MMKQDIINLEGKPVTLEELEVIEESPDVKKVEDMGTSGLHPHMHWMIVTLNDGEEISVYL